MANQIQLFSIKILNSKIKIFYCMFISQVSLFIIFNCSNDTVYNMGNCLGHLCTDNTTPIEESNYLNSVARNQMSAETLLNENRALRDQLTALQNQNTELLAHEQNLEHEKLEVQEAYNLCENKLQQKENELDSFLEEIAHSAFVDDFAHMETYRKLKSCLEEKQALQQELNSKTSL